MVYRTLSHALGRLGIFVAFAFCVFFGSVPATAEPMRGAGSTFAAPIIVKWAENYRRAKVDGGEFSSPDWLLDYEIVGSVAGMMRLAQPEMDFAASDQPLPPTELQRKGLVQFPIVIGGVAVVATLPGIGPGQLKLSGGLIADIYLGRVTRWTDPRIAALNPGLTLPDLPIRVVHRRDGSGTTFTFAQYLANASGDWRTRVGVNTELNWPVGEGGEGSRGVVERVRGVQGAIAYVEYGQVRRAGLAPVQVDNWTGRFVAPEAAAFQATASAANWAAAQDFYRYLTDVSSPDGYPITATTYVFMPRTPRSAVRAAHVRDMFRLALETGGSDAIALGYIPLPSAVAATVIRTWQRPRKN
jgi:phosphate transport system substrate-binding protein